MTDTNLYFGSPGAQIAIPHPRGGVISTRVRPSSVFTTGAGGARVSRTIQGKRQFVLNWQRLWYETYAEIEAYHHGHNGPGPFVLHDPGRINWLTVNQSSATSHRNDTDGFSTAASGSELASGVIYRRGPRSLEWVLSPWVTLWDNYSPTGSGGWGTADSGQTWSIDPSSTGGGLGYVQIEDGWGTIAPPNPGNQVGMQVSASIPGPWDSGATLVKLDLDTDELIGDGLALPGSAGAYASTPDAALISITADLDLRVDVTLPDYTPSAAMFMLSKWLTTGNQRSYALRLDAAGTLSLLTSADGTTILTATSSVALTAGAGERICFRATIDVNNGASGRTVNFYYGFSTGDLSTVEWLELGLPQVGGATTSIFDSTAVLSVSGIDNGTTSTLTGVVHAAQVRSGIDGTIRAEPNFEGQETGTTSFSDGIRTWTVNGSARIKPTTSHLVRWPGPTGVGAITASLHWVPDGSMVVLLSTAGGSDEITLTMTIPEASSGVWMRTDHTTTLARAKVWATTDDEPDDWDVDLVLAGGVEAAVNVVSLFGARHASDSRLNDGAVLRFDGLEVAYGGLTSQNSAFTLDSPSPVWPGIPVVADLPLVFHTMAKLSAATNGTSTRAQLAWLDSDGLELSTTSGTTVLLSDTDWEQMTATATPPAGAVYVKPRVELVGASVPVSVYLDEFQLQRGTEATDWRPGTGVYPVSVVSLAEGWPWTAPDFREEAVLTLQETGP